MSRKGENIRRRTDGRWEARYIREYLPNGKAKYGYLYGKTYGEAKQKKLDALTGQQKNKRSGNAPTLFGEVLDAWLLSQREFVKPSSYGVFQTMIQSHIRPALSDLPLEAFGRPVVEQYVKDKIKNGRLDGRGGLSPKTVTDHVTLLRLVARYAENQGWLEAPEFKGPKLRKPMTEVYSALDWQQLNRHLRTHLDFPHLGVLLAMHTGLRIGEICGLRFSDVDLNSAVLSVQCTVIRIKNPEADARQKTMVVIGPPKTEASRRRIPLPAAFIPMILDVRRKAASADAFIITGTESIMEPRTFYRKYQSMQKTCGISDYSFHALRHTFATRCIENGCDPKTLNDLLGHANIRMTLERYVPPSFDAKRAAIEDLISKDSWSEIAVSAY